MPRPWEKFTGSNPKRPWEKDYNSPLTTEELGQDLSNPNLGREMLEKRLTSGEVRSRPDPEPLRPSFEAVGATLGGIGGGTYGGPLGMTLGAGAGRAAGSLGYDVYRDVRRQFVDDPSKPIPWDYRLSRAGQDAMMEMLLTGGITASTGTVARALGLRPGASVPYQEARDFGVNLGSANVAEGGIAPGAVKVFGRLPFIGGGAKKAAIRQMGQLKTAFGKMADDISPAARTETDIGINIKAGADTSYKIFRGEADRLYKRARGLSDYDGNVVSTNRIRSAAQKVLDEDIANRAAMTTGGQVQGTLPSDVRKIIEELVDLNPKITVNQYRNIDESLEQLLTSTEKTKGIRLHQVNPIREAGKMALDDAAPSSQAATALKDANDFFRTGREMFEAPVAKKVVSAEKGAFSPGMKQPGRVAPDELGRIAINTRSPQAVADLEKLAGNGVVRDVTRFRIEKAWDAAAQRTEAGKLTFSALRFRRALALDKPRSADYQAFKTMLEKSGGNIDDLEKFARVASNVTRVELVDASTFVARASALRGSGGIMAALKGAATGGLATTAATAGGGAGVGATGILMLAFARGGITMLMKPRQLRWATAALDNKVNVAARRAFALRFLRDALATTNELDKQSAALLQEEINKAHEEGKNNGQ